MILRTSLVLAAALTASVAHAAPNVVNAGFEAPLLSGTTHAYHDKYDLDPTSPTQDLNGNGWFYNGSTGIVTEGDGLFGNLVDDNGTAAGFLQGTNGEPYSTISQTVTGFDAGYYALSFSAAIWLDKGPNPLVVTIDGMELSFSGSSIVKPEGDGFTAYTSNAISLTAGSHLLVFSGQRSDSRAVATFIDDVSFKSVSAVPEPSTYAMMALGLAALAGVSARRKRQG